MLGSGALPRLARSATPGTVALDGNLTQGGLVRGQAPAGARITFEETRLRLTPDGRFAFGFGRDHADDAALDIVYADGRKETRSLKVAKREYQIQRIDGLPEQMVTPPPEALERIARDNKLIGAARARHRRRRFRGRFPLAGKGADLRRLWQPAHPERRAPASAFRRRHRRARRNRHRRARRRDRRDGRTRHVLHGPDRDPRPRPRHFYVLSPHESH